MCKTQNDEDNPSGSTEDECSMKGSRNQNDEENLSGSTEENDEEDLIGRSITRGRVYGPDLSITPPVSTKTPQELLSRQ